MKLGTTHIVTRILLPLFLCLALSLAPALAQDEQPAEQEALRQNARQLTEQMQQGEFAPTMAQFAPALAAQISEQQLRAALAQGRLLAGAYEGIIGSHYFEADGSRIVDVYTRQSGKPLRFRYPYDQEGLLGGFWMQPVNWEEVSKLFPQAAVTQAIDERGREYPVAVGAYELPGLLTVPAADASRLPIAVVIVGGSGPTDRDGTIGAAGNRPLRDLAMGLAGRGISSLRYDKRSLARPEALGNRLTIQGEVLEDAISAVSLLEAHALTADAAIFLIGHSLGGMLAPALLEQSPALRGAVIMAGSPRTLWDIIYDQNLAAVTSMADMVQPDKDALMAQVAAMRDAALAITGDSEQTPFGLPASYIASLNALDLANTAKHLTQPLLIIQGETDFQVSTEKDYTAWQKLLGDAENAQFMLYPGLNHLFMKGESGTIADYDLPGQMDDGVIDDIAQWLIAQQDAE